MLTVSHIPLSLSFPSFNYRNPLFYYHHRHRHQQPQLFVSYLNSTKKHDFVCFACFINQPRVRKRVKSNEELRSEIMELVALAGLPEGHVPSMKELSAHGRVDLANIVRRRGYKFLRELLANSDMEDCNGLVSENHTNIETSSSGICLEDSLTEGQGVEALDVVDGKLSTGRPSRTEIYFTTTDGSMPLDQKRNNFQEGAITNSSSESEEHGILSKDESSLAGVSTMENPLSNLGESNYSGEITENDLKIESLELNIRADIESSSSEASNHSLVLDDTSRCSNREAENVLMTEDVEVSDVDEGSSLTYDHYTSQYLNYTKHVDSAPESFSSENFQNQQNNDMAKNRSGSADHSVIGSRDKDWMLGLSFTTSSIEEKTTRFIENGYLDTVDGDSYDGQRSLTTPPNGRLEDVTHATEVNSSDRNTDQGDGSADMDKDSHDETMKRENQVEITRLRFMLRQKELELSMLKEQIEKEKLSLSVLQRQAETEIQKAQMLISEKDVELQEAEESLSGLQEVEIEYCGDGNVVELTGSFNGWEHRVGLELQASKSIGKQKCWSTLLWLYPGTYEIKFIVDGAWTTDPQRDSVTRGHITNNTLKVDK